MFGDERDDEFAAFFSNEKVGKRETECLAQKLIPSLNCSNRRLWSQADLDLQSTFLISWQNWCHSFQTRSFILAASFKSSKSANLQRIKDSPIWYCSEKKRRLATRKETLFCLIGESWRRIDVWFDSRMLLCHLPEGPTAYFRVRIAHIHPEKYNHSWHQFPQ